MAYQTGTATGIADLLDKLVIFLNANGFTQDAYATDGTGKRYHAHNSAGLYVNTDRQLMKIIGANVVNSFPSTAATGIALNVGTGYNSGQAWYNQTGVGQGGTKYMVAGVNFPNAALPAYHFFSHNSGASVFVVIEWQAGLLPKFVLWQPYEAWYVYGRRIFRRLL
jgi:hypothetical protein